MTGRPGDPVEVVRVPAENPPSKRRVDLGRLNNNSHIEPLELRPKFLPLRRTGLRVSRTCRGFMSFANAHA